MLLGIGMLFEWKYENIAFSFSKIPLEEKLKLINII